MSIWDFQKNLSTTLQGWAATSIGTGLLMTATDEDMVKGMGEQFAGWGMINLAIATFGKRSAARRRKQPDALSPAVVAQETRNLQRLLWINTGLDVLYVLGGLRLVQTKGAEDARWRGRGWGIVVQGGFLFVFDAIQATALARQEGTEEVG
jgi:hypothetical protein